jgi:hypothetical protein
MSNAKRRFDLEPDAPSALAIRSILEGLDHVAQEHERKWGIGRLRLIVDDVLRARFDRQRALLDDAIASNLEAQVRDQAEAMKRGWAEHATAKQLIAEIENMKVGDPLFDAKVKVLGEYINHHVEEEEKEIFPESRDADLDLKALGEQLAKREDELMTKGGKRR